MEMNKQQHSNHEAEEGLVVPATAIGYCDFLNGSLGIGRVPGYDTCIQIEDGQMTTSMEQLAASQETGIVAGSSLNQIMDQFHQPFEEENPFAHENTHDLSVERFYRDEELLAGSPEPSPNLLDYVNVASLVEEEESCMRKRRRLSDVDFVVEEEEEESLTPFNVFSSPFREQQKYVRAGEMYPAMQNAAVPGARGLSDPQNNLLNSPKWTREERDLLLQAVAQFGPGNWKVILSDPAYRSRFNGRSAAALARKWKRHQKKLLRLSFVGEAREKGESEMQENRENVENQAPFSSI